VRNKITTITDNATLFLGSHKLMAGVSWEHQVALNTFLRSYYGSYAYKSLNDFLTGAAPDNVALTWGYNGVAEPTDQVTFNQLGVYLQDEWNAFERLKLTLGVRFDNLMFNNKDLLANAAIDALDYEGVHPTTGEWPKSHLTISPRLGFVWDVMGDKSLKVRGGSGLFVGRLPLVFFTNMPGSTGMSKYLYKSSSDKTYGAAVVSALTGGIRTNPDELRDIIVANNPNAKTTITPDEGSIPSNVSLVDNKFKMPQVWKSSIAVDYNFPVSFPLSITGEFTYTKVINDVYLEDISIKGDNSSWSQLRGADNRVIYPKDYRLTDANGKYLPNAYMLTNTNQGWGYTANVTLNAEPIKNLRLMAAYTYTKMKEKSSMPGSNASSVLQAMYAVNGPRFADLQSTSFVLPHRVVASLSYDYHNEHISLFYEGCASNSAYTYYYSGDLNGDGQATDLMYIPANDNEISFASEADRFAFWQFVEQDDYLRNHKGEYAGAYDVHTPMVHRFDLRYAHDITLCIGSTRHRLQLSADVKNIGNLLNSKWGVFKNMAPANGGQILHVADKGWKYDATTGETVVYSAPKFSMNKVNGAYPTQTWDYIHDYHQCWQIQVGAKYYFDQLSSEERDRLCKPCREELTQMDIDKLNAMVAERDAENARLKEQLANIPTQTVAKPEVKVVEKEVKVVEMATVPVSVFFEGDQSVVGSKKDLENVKELAQVARERNAKVVVTGYADSKTGNTELNQRLSQQRAEYVADQLVAYGVSRSNIEIVAGGGVNALNPYNFNRRVTVELK
jgi:outer membrane protein OmpA-like peptidoglycan-associated protein